VSIPRGTSLTKTYYWALYKWGLPPITRYCFLTCGLGENHWYGVVLVTHYSNQVCIDLRLSILINLEYVIMHYHLNSFGMICSCGFEYLYCTFWDTVESFMVITAIVMKFFAWIPGTNKEMEGNLVPIKVSIGF
jgi:hypothetical protein